MRTASVQAWRPTQVEPGLYRLAFSRFMARRANVLALTLVGFALALAVVPSDLVVTKATSIAIQDRLAPPLWAGGTVDHPLGADILGRDVLARVIFAARYSVGIMLSAALLAALVGSIAGLLAGYLGGTADALISRLIDIQIAIPVVFLAIAVLATAGSSLVNVVCVLVVIDWAAIARLIRASALEIRGREFVEAARSVGAGDLRIIVRHILPNVLSAIIVLTSYAAARILLTESALGFLGLGVTPPDASWGGMVGDGRNYLYQASWLAVVPGTAIAMLVFGVSFLGDGLRDALDPRLG